MTSRCERVGAKMVGLSCAQHPAPLSVPSVPPKVRSTEAMRRKQKADCGHSRNFTKTLLASKGETAGKRETQSRGFQCLSMDPGRPICPPTAEEKERGKMRPARILETVDPTVVSSQHNHTGRITSHCWQSHGQECSPHFTPACPPAQYQPSFPMGHGAQGTELCESRSQNLPVWPAVMHPPCHWC